MKITKTEFKKEIGNGSSYKVYICKDFGVAMELHNIAFTMNPNVDGGYWHVHSAMGVTKCLVPEFFHDRKFSETIVEHNNGDWNKESTYELYIVE